MPPEDDAPTGQTAPVQSEDTPKSSEEGYYKRQFDKAQAELDRLKKASLSESERQRADAKEWETRAQKAESELQATRLNIQCLKIAQDSGAASPSAVAKLMAEHVAIDEAGKIINAEKALAAVKKEAPGLFRPATASASGFGVTERPAPKQTLGSRMDQIIRQQLGLGQ